MSHRCSAVCVHDETWGGGEYRLQGPSLDRAPAFDFRHHSVVTVRRYGRAFAWGCGDNNCSGGCGLPALLATYSDGTWLGRVKKVSGSQVACGAVMQDLRVTWRGEYELLPADVAAALFERMWW